jgi:ketosteroid isomerase-like protein
MVECRLPAGQGRRRFLRVSPDRAFDYFTASGARLQDGRFPDEAPVMTRFPLAALSLLLPMAALAQTPAAPAEPAPSAEECAVFRAEAAFARSVAEGDREAFAASVHPDAVFSGNGPASKGRDAVIAAWEFAFDPSQPKLRWAPSKVAIGARSDLALSRGPYWIEHTAPDAPHRFAMGEFTSVWSRNADGSWQVLFDGGSGAIPVDEATLRKRIAALPASCGA